MANKELHAHSQNSLFEELIESKKCHLDLIENMHEIIFLCDKSGNLTFLNNMWERLLGYSVEESLGRCIADFLHKEENKNIVTLISEKKKHIELQFYHRDGRAIWLELSVYACYKESFAGLLYNITKKKNAEQTIKSIVEINSDGFLIVDKENIVCYVNPAAKILFENRKEQLLGGAFHFQLTTYKTQEIEITNRKGETRIAEMRITETEWESKDAYLVALRDITDQKAVVEAFKAEKERLNATLISIGDGVITTDTTGKIILINKTAEVLTGWKQKEAVGALLDNIFHIVNRETHKICENPAKRILDTNNQIIEERHNTLLVTKEGFERLIDFSGVPILSKEYDILGTVLAFRDVTEHKKLEDKVAKSSNFASLGLLAGGLAHDFNNILTVIVGNINLAMLSIKDDKSALETLSNAEHASLQARDLTQQLLVFSKGGAPIKETVSIAEIIKESMRFILRGSKVKCAYDINDDLWAVDVDKGQMNQIFNNLTINALQAMPDGGQLEIQAKNRNIWDENGEWGFILPKGKYVKISFKDSGVGISEDNLKKIFDPYFTSKEKGNGLGLATTCSIVKKHGGFINVESELGKGTTFFIYVPASTKDIMLKKEVKGAIAYSNGEKVLLMDDEEVIREIGKRILEYLKYEVVIANDGKDAIEKYKIAKEYNKPFDAIILDLTVSGHMGGAEAIKEIVNIDHGVKAIVSGGVPTDPVLVNFKEYGFKDAISKPYNIEKLSNVLHNVVTST